MLKIAQHSKFKSDSKRLIRSGRFSESDEKNLFDVIENLAQGKKLEQRYRDHPLNGNWRNHRECHIKPDLLLIYRDEYADFREKIVGMLSRKSVILTNYTPKLRLWFGWLHKLCKFDIFVRHKF